MFFRRGVSHDEWLRVKLWLFGAGALLALFGMGLRSNWLMGLAGMVLAAGVLLRFLNRDGESRDDGDSQDRDSHDGDAHDYRAPRRPSD